LNPSHTTTTTTFTTTTTTTTAAAAAASTTSTTNTTTTNTAATATTTSNRSCKRNVSKTLALLRNTATDTTNNVTTTATTTATTATPYEPTDADLQLAVYVAAGNGHLDTLDYIFDRSGGRVDECTLDSSYEQSPLMAASLHDRAAVVDMLVARRRRSAVRDALAAAGANDGGDAAAEAAKKAAEAGEAAVIAYVNQRDKQQQTPLAATAFYCYPNTMLALLRAGADGNAVVQGVPLLHMCVYSGNYEGLLLLLKQKNINKEVLNAKQQTPLQMAEERDAQPLVDALLGAVCARCRGSSDGGSKAPTLLVCSRCKRRRYCGVECQKADWKSHKPHCKGGAQQSQREETRRLLKELAAQQQPAV